MITASELLEVVPNLEGVQAKTALLNRLGHRFLETGSVRGVTALKTTEAIREEFLVDSLVVVNALPAQGRVIDIGTGGGVPGLVLAIARPDLEFFLADSASKKTRWVQEVTKELELDNVTVLTGRLEALGRDPDLRASFTAVTAKALASLPVLVEFSLPLLEVGGRLIALKGPALAEEIEASRKALSLLFAAVHRCWAYGIGQKEYRICEILKLGATPEKYPRRDGVPQKKPL